MATVLALGSCKSTGGGYIGAAVDETFLFNGDADFGFSFQCDYGVKGQITYHDSSTKAEPGVVLYTGLRLHGTVENILVDDDYTDDIPAVPAETCEDVVESSWAQFQGTYRSQETNLLSALPGKFTILVFDQGEPSRPREVGITGDYFSIDLLTGPYMDYTRAGYIEGGNIQVDQ
jgi:hypothetical protein